MRIAKLSCAGVVVILSALALVATCSAGQEKLSLRSGADKVGKYEKIEFDIQPAGSHRNPFDPDEVDLSIVYESPGGKRLTVPAFFCQPYQRRRLSEGRRQSDWMYPNGLPGWKARFAPAEVGTYRATAVLKDAKGTVQSAPVKFACIPSTRKGYLRTSPRDPRFFEFTDGTPFFAVGQNLAFIGEGQRVNLARAEDIFATLGQYKANYLRIWTCCEDWAMAIEARKSAFGRSWGWKPPFAPMPDGAEADKQRKCIKLAGDGASVSISPSHPVALRPGTKYLFSAQVKTDAPAAVRFEVHRTRAEKDIASGADGRWTAFRHEFTTGPNDLWLGSTAARQSGSGSAYLRDLSLKEAAGGPELLWEADPNRPIITSYNPVDCFMLDELLAAAEKHGIYLQLCLVTRDLYMAALKNDKSPEYDKAIRDIKKLFRYAVARWGYSPNVAAWEYFNEIDPNLPTDRFYTELGEYLEQIDVYQHLRTTSTWHPSPKDMRHPKLDIADLHFYLRPSEKRLKDEVDAAGDRTRFLRQHAPNKLAHLGEFGLANDKFQPTEEMRTSDQVVEFHNAMWASALSGASGTCLFWWWERLDTHNAYPHYGPLTAYLADIPWTSEKLQPSTATASNEQVRVVGLQGRDRAYLWLFNSQAAWSKVVIEKGTPTAVKGLTVELKDLAPQDYRIEWWDTATGKISQRARKDSPKGQTMRLAVPDFQQDIAVKVVGER